MSMENNRGVYPIIVIANSNYREGNYSVALDLYEKAY